VLTAVVIQLEGTPGTRAQLHTAAIRSWLLGRIQELCPDLLPMVAPPEPNNAPVPYTISGVVPDGDGWHLRITTLHTPLSRLLIDTILPNLPEHLTLDTQTFRVLGWTIDHAVHGRAGSTTFTQLAAEALDIAEPTTQPVFAFRLLTPACFRNKGLDFPWPEPPHFYGSLLNRWQTFSETLLPLPLAAFFEQQITVAAYQLGTRPHYEIGRLLGCTGYIRFQVKPRVASPPDERQDWLHRVRMVSMLSKFAFYAGIGAKTTFGMGQADPL